MNSIGTDRITSTAPRAFATSPEEARMRGTGHWEELFCRDIKAREGADWQCCTACHDASTWGPCRWRRSAARPGRRVLFCCVRARMIGISVPAGVVPAIEYK